jgi:hypothetical protein
MSAIEMKERLHAIIDSHAGNEAWLARIFEILESAEPVSNDNWWAELSDEQKKRIDESVLAADMGEYISNEGAFESL